MNTLRHLWAHHKIALSAFVVALAALTYFSVTTLASALYWMDPAHQNQPLADWMTPRYVAKSYHLPREVIEEVFFIERGAEPRRIRLMDVAAEHGMTMADLQARLNAANAAFEAEQGAPRDQ